MLGDFCCVYIMFIVYILTCCGGERRKAGKEKERWRVTDGEVSRQMGEKKENRWNRRRGGKFNNEGRREEEVVRRDSGKEKGRERESKARLCEARQAATTGCAYFMAATYHKSLSLMGERRSDDFKEITCRTRPTYTQPCWATQPLHAASKAAPNPL